MCRLFPHCLPVALLFRMCLPFSGVQDVFDMMQSPTFVMQLGYGVLEILTVNVFPEMKTIFRSLEAGDL